MDAGADRVAPPLEPMPGEEFRDSGLLYLANRALHPFGAAINLDDDGRLFAVVTSHPVGLVYQADEEVHWRRRLREWLRRRADPSEVDVVAP